MISDSLSLSQKTCISLHLPHPQRGLPRRGAPYPHPAPLVASLGLPQLAHLSHWSSGRPSQERVLAGSCKPFSWSERRPFGSFWLPSGPASLESFLPLPHNYSPHGIWLKYKSSYCMYPAQFLQRPRPPTTKKAYLSPSIPTMANSRDIYVLAAAGNSVIMC